MIKIWGRNTSSNVQKAMWAVGELKLEHERIDVGGAFGKNKEPAYLAMNPNALVPTLEEEDGFTLWESNSIVRYLAGKHDKSGVLEPKDAKQRALASQWMDWQLSVVGPGNHAGILGPDPHAGGKTRHGRDQGLAGKNHRRDEMLDAQLAKTAYRRRRGIFLRRHSGRRHVLSLSCSWCRTGRRAESRSLVRRDLKAQGVPGSCRQRSAVLNVISAERIKAPRRAAASARRR